VGKQIVINQALSFSLGVYFGGPKMDEKGLAVRKWPEARLAPLKFVKLALRSLGSAPDYFFASLGARA
jgi:hypothetical protein